MDFLYYFRSPPDSAHPLPTTKPPDSSIVTETPPPPPPPKSLVTAVENEVKTNPKYLPSKCPECKHPVTNQNRNICPECNLVFHNTCSIEPFEHDDRKICIKCNNKKTDQIYSCQVCDRKLHEYLRSAIECSVCNTYCHPICTTLFNKDNGSFNTLNDLTFMERMAASNNPKISPFAAICNKCHAHNMTPSPKPPPPSQSQPWLSIGFVFVTIATIGYYMVTSGKKT